MEHRKGDFFSIVISPPHNLAHEKLLDILNEVLSLYVKTFTAKPNQVNQLLPPLM